MNDRTSEQKLALQCVIAEGALVIIVSASVVKYATEHHPDFYDADNDVYLIKVADEQEWLRSVSRRLTEQFEGGSTPLSELFDKAIYKAVDQGDEGLAE